MLSAELAHSLVSVKSTLCEWQRSRLACIFIIEAHIASFFKIPTLDMQTAFQNLKWDCIDKKIWKYSHNLECFFTFIPVPLSSLFLSFISSTISSVFFLPFSGRRHKMTHKGWRVVKPQINQNRTIFAQKLHKFEIIYPERGYGFLQYYVTLDCTGCLHVISMLIIQIPYLHFPLILNFEQVHLTIWDVSKRYWQIANSVGPSKESDLDLHCFYQKI